MADLIRTNKRGSEYRGWEGEKRTGGGDRPRYELVKGDVCATERLLSRRSMGLNRCDLMSCRPLSSPTDDRF